ncbi:MAG: hypothetical protein WAT19_07685 [Ferruginibacter sp.]
MLFMIFYNVFVGALKIYGFAAPGSHGARTNWRFEINTFLNSAHIYGFIFSGNRAVWAMPLAEACFTAQWLPDSSEKPGEAHAPGRVPDL